MRLAQESGFTLKAFCDLGTAHGIDLHFSGAQSDNLAGCGEIYHEPLRPVFQVLRQRYNNMVPEKLLRYAVKGLNDSIGPKELVASLLVFRIIPAFLMSKINTREQEERLEMMHRA